MVDGDSVCRIKNNNISRGSRTGGRVATPLSSVQLDTTICVDVPVAASGC